MSRNKTVSDHKRDNSCQRWCGSQKNTGIDNAALIAA